MSVLNRSMFNAPVRMHKGGLPQHKHTYDQNISDAEIQTLITEQQGELDEMKKTTGTYKQLSGIMEGFDDSTVQKATIEAEKFAKGIYPEKTAQEYRDEAKLIYSTDFSSQRALIDRQKQEDIASNLIGFGARLATGRGKALDVLGQAVQQTLPEFTAARRATRKDEATLKDKEKTAKSAIQSYALTKQNEEKVNRAKLMVDATFKNLDFFQEIAKTEMSHNWDLDTTIVPVTNVASGLGTEVKLGDYLNDMKLPKKDRKFMKEVDYEKPFEMWDNLWKTNRVFTNYEAFALKNKASPKRYEDPHDDPDLLKVKSMKIGDYTHPVTGKATRGMIQEMSNGTYMIPKFDENGNVFLQANGHPVMIPIGQGMEDLLVGQDVALTAEDMLPPKVQMEQLSTILLYDRNIRSINKVIANLAEDKTRAGIVGQLKEAIQIGKGMITDVMSQEGKDAIFGAVQEEMSNINRISEKPEEAEIIKALFDPKDPRSAAFFGDFDPKLAENRTRVNAIAYAVARSRKDSGRLNLDDIKKAYESLKVTGFTDAKTAITQLYTIRDELMEANKDMKMIYHFYGGELPDGYEGTKEYSQKDVPMAVDTNGDGIVDTFIMPWEIKE